MLSLLSCSLICRDSFFAPSKRCLVTCFEINAYCSLNNLSFSVSLSSSLLEFLKRSSWDRRELSKSSRSFGATLCLRATPCSWPKRWLSSTNRSGLTSNCSWKERKSATASSTWISADARDAKTFSSWWGLFLIFPSACFATDSKDRIPCSPSESHADKAWEFAWIISSASLCSLNSFSSLVNSSFSISNSSNSVSW